MSLGQGLQIPDDVKKLIGDIFADCNAKVSQKLSRIPNLHETSLDHSFIEHFTHHCRPVHTPSDWTVRIDCHFIGGGRHWDRWEVADFGILVVFRHKGQVWRSKVTLLQSKRLFPKENQGLETNPLDVALGFNFLFHPDDIWADLSAPRVFTFDNDSLYRSLHVGDEQYTSIKKYEQRHEIPVNYLLYNPLTVPTHVSFPVTAGEDQLGKCLAGCRVVPSRVLRSMVESRATERPPSYGEMMDELAAPFSSGQQKGGWRLETYIVDQLLACKDGLIDKTPQFDHISHIFSQKSMPIHAALVITFDMPAIPG